MNKELTCIVCPRGCHLVIDEKNNVSGNICPRGAKYAISEMTNPVRNISSIMRVKNRTDLVVSVKTNAPIPKKMIFEVMEQINKIGVNAPCHIGDVAIKNVLNTGVDIVITKNID